MESPAFLRETTRIRHGESSQLGSNFRDLVRTERLAECRRPAWPFQKEIESYFREARNFRCHVSVLKEVSSIRVVCSLCLC